MENKEKEVEETSARWGEGLGEEKGLNKKGWRLIILNQGVRLSKINKQMDLKTILKPMLELSLSFEE